jgi:outer membrane lipoprotein-sorting protein
MRKLIFLTAFLITNFGFAQKLSTAEQVIEKYLDVTKIKNNAASITDMVYNLTSESPRGVAETEIKYLFPFKYNMGVYANGMTIMNSIYDGEKIKSVSGFGGGNQEPKTGQAAKNEAFRLHPFMEMEYKNQGVSATLLPEEGEHYVVEFKDSDGKIFKAYYNQTTGFKDKVWAKTETPRGSFESTSGLESYKAFKGSEILFPSVRKQTTQMGEITSELQSIKFNKGIKPKEFEIK